MSPQEFRETHGRVEDWSAEDFEHYLETCAQRAPAGPQEPGVEQ